MDGPSSIHIIGAGGIGCAVGYALCAAGVNVTFIDADAAKVAWGRANGVRVDQRPPLVATFLHFDQWQPPSDAPVLLCTKCYDNPAVLARLPKRTELIPIQNGFDSHLDANGHASEGIASFVSECLPGRTHTRITRRGKLHLGSRHHTLELAIAADSLREGEAPAEPITEAGLCEAPVAGLCEAGRGRRPRLPNCRSSLALPVAELAASLRKAGLFPVEVVPDILPYKYTKLMYNAAISPLAAAAGLDNGQLLSVRLARRLFFELLRENYAILHGAGVELARIGPFHPDTVQRILRHAFLANALAWAFYPSLRGSYCSMAGDLPKGRTEIDNYNGHLVEIASERRGVAPPSPLNRRVYDMVKRMERDGIAPGIRVLEELADFTAGLNPAAR